MGVFIRRLCLNKLMYDKLALGGEADEKMCVMWEDSWRNVCGDSREQGLPRVFLR